MYYPKEIKVAGDGDDRGGGPQSERRGGTTKAWNTVDVTQPKWAKNEDGPKPGEALQALSETGSTWMCMSFNDICSLHASKNMVLPFQLNTPKGQGLFSMKFAALTRARAYAGWSLHQA